MSHKRVDKKKKEKKLNIQSKIIWKGFLTVTYSNEQELDSGQILKMKYD